MASCFTWNKTTPNNETKKMTPGTMPESSYGSRKLLAHPIHLFSNGDSFAAPLPLVHFFVRSVFFSLFCFSSNSNSDVTSSITSLVEFLNSFKVWPTARPNCGNLAGPKMINAIIRIKINPGTPIFGIRFPSFTIEFLFQAFGSSFSR